MFIVLEKNILMNLQFIFYYFAKTMNLRRYYLQKLMNTIFLKRKLVDLCIDLILNDLKSMEVGWNMVLKMMLHIVYIVTYSIEIYISY